MSVTLLLAAAALALQPADPVLPTIPPATIDETLEVAGDGLAAQQVRTRMFLGVAVNGSGPYRFLVDSGADRSVIGVDLAKTLALPSGPMVRLQSMAGTSEVTTVRVGELRIGTSAIDGIIAPALPERYLGAQGLIGIDALADQRVMFDFDAKTITVQDSRRPVTVAADEIVVTARRRNGQLILTQASVAGQRLFAVVDTGSEITMGNSALQARVFRGRRPPPAQPITLLSVTGQKIVANLVVVPEVRIGGVVLVNVPIAFADVAPFALFGLGATPAVLLGTDVLEAFKRVSLDFRNRKVRFVLRRGSRVAG